MRAAAQVSGIRYSERLPLTDSVSVAFAQASHILGSATIGVDVTTEHVGRRIVFSGDVGRYDAAILPDPAPIGDADYVVVESTYGDRRHDPTPVLDQLERVMKAALARGGAIVVPAFAVGRTQELMYRRLLWRAGRLARLPSYVDSPMAIDATEDLSRSPRGLRRGHACAAGGRPLSAQNGATS